MRIKRLDITGFKSFMDRTVFSFDDGITGVVGPNGCGKSNVVDAIRWAMGEQSAKNLRGRGMEDVIFNGSETQPPLSMAEVSLTFRVEPTDVLAPQYAGFPEVTVTRRLFRSGESEYLINKTTCRLLDITELFLGTGVGTRAYSIIEQGRVGLIVSAKPEDRRALIEEAAGVTKYKARRKAAERKMEYTQQNLVRVNDIVSELERRLDSLQRQARKAEKYRQVKAEIREVELHQASHRFLELIAQGKVLQARLESLSTEERAALDQLRAMEDGIESRRARLDEDGLALERLAKEVHQLSSQDALDEQSLSHWATDAAETEARVREAREEVAALFARRTEASALAERREAEVAELLAAWKQDDVALQVADEELRRAAELQSQVARQLEAERAELLDVATRIGNVEVSLAALGQRRADLEARQARARAESDQLRAQEAELDQARGEVARRVVETRQTAIEIAERRGLEEAQLLETRQAFAESEIKVIAAREALADKRSRLASLEEIQRHYEGFDRGVRAVMLKVGDRAREEGIFGLVSDVISTDQRFEKAVEAALGERLQHVVVEDREKGLQLLEYLRTVSEGRSTFVPARPAAPAVERAAPDLTRPGVVAHALAEIRCEDALRPLVESLLGEVVIMADLASARAYAQDGGQALTLVTLEGEVLRPDGSVTGGALEGPAVGALQKKREIAELAVEVKALEEQYGEILTRHYSLQKQMGHTEGVLKGLAKHQHAEELTLATQEKDLHQAGADLSRLRERLSALAQEEAHLGASLGSLGQEEEGLRGQLLHAHTDRERREDKVRLLASELESLKARAERASAQSTELKIKVAQSAERGEAARAEISRLNATREEIAQRLTRLEETINQGTSRLAELAEQITQASARRADGLTRLGQLSATLEERRKAHAGEVAAVREQEGVFRELRGHLDQLTQGLSQISLQERELTLQMQHLVSQIQERHQADLHHELHRYHLSPGLPSGTEARLKDLRAQVERMGEINVTAIEEHAELSKRYDFLAGQKKDLEASLQQLQLAIKKIDRTSRDRFKQTFEVVNEKFQQIFPRLFGGGRAGLVLTDDPQGGEQGVEIIAQPPGKKLQSVGLLSGGEKALTAVSLIFAIFLIKPTPFCLLDEVDAPLDEGNLGRYNDMVKEMSQQSQFILITHNKRTMEIADTLYGVTMEEPGISKLVAVKMKEAVAANDDAAA
jgi:chromosome segregation protein